MNYIGRFAPSPTGPLHAGSVATALGSWLDARAHQGKWLVRIEDIDTPRNVSGTDQYILHTLKTLGLAWDGDVLYQSQHTDAYRSALNHLLFKELAYPCACSRREIADSITQGRIIQPAASTPTENGHTELIYPGTCAKGIAPRKQARSIRFRVPIQPIRWLERLHGERFEELTKSCGDFVIQRADRMWAYQLAMVVDDAAQDVTHIVRGADLMTSTARQIALQQALGLPTPTYCHLPVVLGSNGEKLSKQNGAQAVQLEDPLSTLNSAFVHLGFKAMNASNLGQWLQKAVSEWSAKLTSAQGSAR